MPSAVLVIAGPIELFPDKRQMTLWSSCSTKISLSVGLTLGEPRRGDRVLDGVSNGNSNHENTLVVDVDDQSTVGREEGKAHQTSLMAHTSSLRLVVQRAHCTSDHVHCWQYA